MTYNWQQSDWPDFRYSLDGIQDDLSEFKQKFSFISGLVTALAENTQMEVLEGLMISEAIKTSEIEGEFLSRHDVKSSIQNKLGLQKPSQEPKDKKSVGAGELMVLVRNSYSDDLSRETLFEWHRTLMKGDPRIISGIWRSSDKPMQIVSGAFGRLIVHFEAPPSGSVANEMERFIDWFNATGPKGKTAINQAPVRAAIAHLYFETIHPFEDGNGRIGRAIAEKALAQTLGHPVLLSLSSSIEASRKEYYKALQDAQRHNDITAWVQYFVSRVLAAQIEAGQVIEFTLQKAKFFDRFRSLINERQLKAIQKMMDAGPEGFTGGMSASKYMAITKAPKSTATRDLQYLLEKGVFRAEGGGRSTRYYFSAF